MSTKLDVLLAGGTVCDGSGAEGETVHVGIADDRIAYIGREAMSAHRVIDVSGLVVAPGFIDMHVHSDLVALVDPYRDSQIFQGVTTEVVGQDGLGYAPMSENIAESVIDSMTAWNGRFPDKGQNLSVDDYLAMVDERSRLNVAYLMPHGTIRMNVMGFEDRLATERELQQMSDILRGGLKSGAFGLSAGLTYAPGMYCDNDELIRLNQVVAEFDGIYAPHHRNYGRGALQAYEECIEIAEVSGVRLHLTHAHLGFEANRGKAGTFLDMLEAATSRGVEVSLDAYPYGPAATSLVALLPAWMHQLSPSQQVEALSDECTIAALGEELEQRGTIGHMGEPVDWRRVIVASVTSESLASLPGMSIWQIAQNWGVDPMLAAAHILLTDEFHTGVIVDIGNEENVDAIVTSRFHTAGSDGMFVGDRPHPRGFGSHARLIAEYVRNRGLLTLEDMVHHMTGAPAQVLGLHDRGLVKVGYVADLAVFNPDTFTDRATFENPCELSEGMHTVMINGQIVLDGGSRLEGVPGCALRRRIGSKAGRP